MLRSRKTIGVRAAMVWNTIADAWCSRRLRARATIVFDLRSFEGPDGRGAELMCL